MKRVNTARGGFKRAGTGRRGTRQPAVEVTAQLPTWNHRGLNEIGFTHFLRPEVGNWYAFGLRREQPASVYPLPRKNETVRAVFRLRVQCRIVVSGSLERFFKRPDFRITG